jgi:fatty acid desaturase
MTAKGANKDYSLTGRNAKLAQDRGLVGANWYTCHVSRKELKELMRRKDYPAIRDTVIWLGALAISGCLAHQFWGRWWAGPFLVAYGVLYGSAAASRWHECSHGTPFRTRWLNDAIYHLASFMVLREPTVWRWSHTRHHTDTIIVGRDREIAVPRPPSLLDLLLNIFVLKATWISLRSMILHTFGHLTAEERSFIPAMEHWKVYGVARIWVSILVVIGVACVATRSVLPAVFVGLPTLYGGFLVEFFGLTLHAGLAEDVLDHRLNTRTVYMNPVFRFLYWNMNYHLEHHMFPMVPYHALPRLHAAIKADCPRPYRSTIEAYREIIPTLLRQRRDTSYCVARQVPDIARGIAHTNEAPLSVSES